MNSSAKGDRSERQLVNTLDARGWEVIRVPASGSATTRDLPDVLAGRNGVAMAIEDKASGGDPIYLDAEEVAALQRFGRNYGAAIYISANFNSEPGDPSYGEDWHGHHLLRVNNCHETPAGNYRVKKETAHGIGEPVISDDLEDIVTWDVEQLP